MRRSEKKQVGRMEDLLRKILLISTRFPPIHSAVGSPEDWNELEQVMDSSQQKKSEGGARKIELWRAFSAA